MGVFRLRGDRFQVEIFEDGGRRNRDLERWLEVHGLLSTDRKDGFEEVILDYSTRYVADMHSYPGWVPNDDNPMRALFDVPVALDGNLWGVIEFSSRTLGGLSEGVREVLDQIGSSIELALMKQADRERQALQIAKMQAVVETSELLRGLVSRQQVVQHSLEAVLEMTRTDQCNLLLYDADEGVLKVVGSLHRSQEWRAQRVGDELAQGEGLSWQVFEAGRTLRFRDENGLGQVADQQEAGKPIAFVGTPTRNQEGEVVGVLTASLDDPAVAFRADDIGFLEAIAQACSSALLRLTLLEKSQNQAIEYRRLYTSAERQAQELALLDRVRTAVARELELDELFYSTVESISEILGYGLVSAYWLEGDELVLQSQVGYDRVVERLPIGEGIMGRAVRTMAPILVSDVRRDPDQASVHEGVVSQVAVPIIANEGVVGVIDIASREVDLDENDLRVMMRLSEQVGAAAERARLYGVVRDREQRFRLLAENMSDMVCLHEPAGRFAYVSPSCLGVLGYSPEALLDRDFVDLVHPEDRKLLGDRLFQQRVAEDSASQAIYRIRHAEGYYVWFETTAQPIIEQGLLTGLMTASRDITERHMIEEKLVQGALYDDLTGLPNRALLMDRLAQALERRVRTESRFAVLFLDLDRFKIINDSLGHAAGDELLKAIGERLKTCVRTIDTVARLGGDEFCLLLEDLHGQEEATQTATRIQRALTQPFTVDEHDIFTSASIGIAFSSSHYGEPQELLRDADIAMYRAKNAGKARHAVFDHAMHDQAVNLMKLETDLHRAVERGELFLEYQPIVHLETGEMAGFEALVRWRHPERGLIEPGDFIPMAEETGQVLSLDRWVLREACRRTAEWQRTFDPGRPLMVSVNFSAMHFTLGDGAEALVKTVLEAGLPPSQLKLEITEGALMNNSSQAVEMLEALRREGIVVQVDDFGTGYSSLSYLHRLPIDSLKIDRSFVQGIEQDSQNLEIVTTIVNLAHSLRIDVVAEGIENAEQLQLLRDLSCEYGQGFHFAKPLTPEEVERRFLHPVSRA